MDWIKKYKKKFGEWARGGRERGEGVINGQRNGETWQNKWSGNSDSVVKVDF